MTARLPRITTDQLVTLKACHEQVVLFRATFGDSATLTKRNLAKAVEVGLDFHWLADHTLKGEHWRAYNEAIATAWRAYNEAIALARLAYNEVVASAWFEAYMAQLKGGL